MSYERRHGEKNSVRKFVKWVTFRGGLTNEKLRRVNKLTRKWKTNLRNVIENMEDLQYIYLCTRPPQNLQDKGEYTIIKDHDDMFYVQVGNKTVVFYSTAKLLDVLLNRLYYDLRYLWTDKFHQTHEYYDLLDASDQTSIE